MEMNNKNRHSQRRLWRQVVAALGGVVLLLAQQASAQPAPTGVTSAAYNDPSIDAIPPVIGASEGIPPNIFLTLDDSGSMGSMSGSMPYDPNVKYEIPPDPNNYRDGVFQPFPMPRDFPISENTFYDVGTSYDVGTGVNRIVAFYFRPYLEGNGYTDHGYGAYNFGNTFRGNYITERYNKTIYVVDVNNNFVGYGRGELFRAPRPFDYTASYPTESVQLDDALLQSECGVVWKHPERLNDNCKIFLKFYATRFAALRSSLALVLTEQSAPFQLGAQTLWGARNLRSGSTSSFSLFPLKVISRSKSNYQRNMRDFLTALYNTFPNQGTPTREAFDRLRKGLRQRRGVSWAGAWGNSVFIDPDAPDPRSPSAVRLCVQNYHVALSDGGYNDAPNLAFVIDDYDGTTHTWDLITADDKVERVTFRGDGSVPEQRLIAGGSRSLYGNPRSIKIAGGISDIVLEMWAEDMEPGSINGVDMRNVVQPTYRQLSDWDLGGVKIPPLWNPRNDPANWQRVVTYTIGLGLSSASELDKEDILARYMRNGPAFGSLYPWSWVQRRGNTSETNENQIDFMRAGLVGRGGTFTVNDPKVMREAFSTIFKDIVNRTSITSLAQATGSSEQVSDSTSDVVFMTKVDIEKRVGDLTAKWLYSGRLEAVGAEAPLPSDAINCFKDYKKGKIPDGAYIGKMCDTPQATWSAEAKMPRWNQRNIYSYSRQRDDSRIRADRNGVGIRFDLNNLNPIQFQAIRTVRTGKDPMGASDQQVIDFIKGDNTNSGRLGFRARENNRVNPAAAPLADFGRTAALYVGDADNRVWKLDDHTRLIRKPMVYIGNNDGMLHAFDAQTGREMFAVLPNAMYKKFGTLIKYGYKQDSYVDGQLISQDIKDEKGKNRTILVSGYGTGGIGLIALDITDPSRFNENNILWELDEKDDPRLGRIMGKASIIRVEGKYRGSLEDKSAKALEDRWVVVVGTGYNNVTNANDKSGVMVIDAVSGKIIDFLELPTAAGVGEIAWIDHQQHEKVGERTALYLDYNPKNSSNDFTADTKQYMGELDRGYVADLAGNLWVLDFSYDKDSPENTRLRSAIISDGEGVNKQPFPQGTGIAKGKPAPLFIATTPDGTQRQTISAGLFMVPHPTNRGYMIYFGTGELFKIAPAFGNIPQSMYGIWDDIGSKYGSMSQSEVEDNNKTRNRFYLTYYPWNSFASELVGNKGRVTYRTFAKDQYASVIKHPIAWANTGIYGDSRPVSPETYMDSVAVPSSGWVMNTGYNAAVDQYERIYQRAYSIRTRDNERGITFLMHTTKSTSDACTADSDIRTWEMSFRTDVVDGPATPFGEVFADNNNDGKVDKEDRVNKASTDSDKRSGSLQALVPIGVSPDAQGRAGMKYSPYVTEGLRGSGGNSSSVCPSGDSRSYKSTDDNGNLNEMVICIPRSLSSWGEIE